MGASPYSHRKIWRIAAPLILSNVTVPMLGIVDTAVVGHLDTPVYLAAVAVGATLFGFLFMGFNFLRMGTTGVAAQALGEDDADALRGVLLQAGAIALGIAALMIALQVPIARIGIALIDPAPDVAAVAFGYVHTRIWAAPAALMNFAVVGWFIGLQNGRAPLAIMLCINGINIALDVVFVVYLGMNARGVALASVIAEFSGLALGAILVWRTLRRYRTDGSGKLWDGTRLKRLLHVNGNLLIRTLSLMFAFAFFTALGARQGSAILAANAVLMNFQILMAYALDGFANAAEALIGRAVGARDRAGTALAYRNTLIWSAGVAVAFVVAFWIGGVPLVNTMTDMTDIRSVAYAYLPWVIVSPVVSVWCFFYDGVFVGATRAKDMRNAMLLSTFAIFVPLAWVLTRALGNHGLWLALLVFMAARGLTLHWRWRALPFAALS